jgi:MtaA/CmuA family methyltransferase
VISDPAREAFDLGADVEWFDDQPPALNESRALLHEKGMLLRLEVPDPADGERMEDRVQGVALLKRRVGGDLLVEGWVEGPCAMSSDLRGINTLMTDFSDDPDFVVDLFEFVVEMELRFARAQVHAGADLIGVGDAAASLVGPAIYRQFVLPYERKLFAGLKEMGARVRLHICGNTKKILAGMGELGADIVDLDYPVPVAMAREAMGPAQVLLGNLNPVKDLRDGSVESVTAAIARCHREAGNHFIVGAGCEVCRGTPDANVFALRDYARR